jgi:hypothetical protein
MRLQETKLVDHIQDIKNGLHKISTEPISYPSREREGHDGNPGRRGDLEWYLVS